MIHRFHRSSRQSLWALVFVMLGLLAVQPVMTSFAAGIDGEVWWAENYHNSRDPLYRTPGGPVAVGTDVTLRLRTEANDLTSAQVRVWNDRQDIQFFLNMAKVASDATHDYWEATLDTGSFPNVFYYRFILNDGGDTDFYEDDSRKWGGGGQMFDDSPDNSWALTVYDPAFETPQWVKDAVFYQVFVDRFNDGNPANNTSAGEFFYGEAGGTIVRSNDTEWNTPVCDPRADTNDTCEGSYSRNFYGGDLQGIIDKLDYLQDLGVTALYLNPIFESPSNHKYDTSDFSVIDDNFGSLSDFQNLVAQAELRGMKIVLDGVFNHTSSQSPYFDRYQIHSTVGACESTSSLYEPMYQFIEGDPTPTCSDGRDYPYWFGIFDSLPVLDSSGEMARDMVWGDGITHPIGGVKPAVAKYWIDQGAAGWRLDVAPEIDHGILTGSSDYWEQFRAAVHSVDPEAYIVGEEWGYSMSWTSGGAQGSVTFPDGNPGEWDATMNYQQSAALLSLWRDTALNAENDFNPGSSAGLLEPYTPSMFVERYLNLKERYSPEAFAAMMNLLGSHDTQRALWLLDHGHPASPAAGTIHPSSASYDWSDAINRLHGVALMQFTLPGAPQIYYGDEIGLVGQSRYDGSSWQDDPYNRQPYPWLDESGTPFFAHLQSAPAQQANYDYYALLTTIRAAHPALRTGEIDFVLVDDANDKLAYLRWMEDGSDTALVLVNRNGTAQDFAVSVGGKVAEGAVFDNMLTEGIVETYTVSGGMLNVTGVPANSGALLVRTSVDILPPAAVSLSATLGGSNVTLNWNASSGATSYDVYRSTLSGAAYTLLGNTVALTYNDTTIVVPEQYYYIVIAKNDTNGLLSDPSNEAFVLTGYDLAGAYLNVQWPPSLTHTISTETPTDYVYGQIWLGGVTDASSSPIAGIKAQVGYAPDASIPDILIWPVWSWFDMEPNPSYDFTQNNDEFRGRLLPNALGMFRYTIRYSGDGGETWHYATDFSGSSQPSCPDRDDFYENFFAFCLLTVNPSSDTTAPSAPTAVKEFDTSSEIGISWSGATDETAISGYRVYRSEDDATMDIVAILDETIHDYIDTDVSSGSHYVYYVSAFDTSFNNSGWSNMIMATAENSLVDVTFTVTVPDYTPDSSVVQAIGGAPQLTNWGAGVDTAATANPNEHAVTLQFEENSTFEYKYRRDGSWDKVEKVANGYDEIANRSFTVGYAEDGPYTIADTVANWRDVLVSATNPADGATDVPVTSNIAVSFNKTVNTASDFDVLDAASQPVAGSFAVDNSAAPTITFEPAANLCPAATYTVNVSGVNAAGDGQQFHSYSFDFTTVASADVAVTFNVTVPGFTPAGDVIYISGNHAALGSDVPNAIAMTDIGGNQWTYTASLPAGAYTYTYTRGSVNNRATEADGETLFSSTVNVAAGTCTGQTATDTVANWLDPLVVNTSPSDGATQQALNTPISVTFSKPVNPASTFTVQDSDAQPVTGAFSYDGISSTLTFTPNANYRSADTISVTVTGVAGAVSGMQIGTYTFSFKTQHTELLRNGDFEGNPPKKKLTPWVLANGTDDKLVCGTLKIYGGQCAFKFTGSRRENSMLLQDVKLTGLTFAAGDELILSAFANSIGSVDLKLILTVEYSGSPDQKVQRKIVATSGYTEFVVPTLALTGGNVTGITVKFKHKSTSSRTFIDDVSLKLRQGNARRGEGITLPVPDIPSGFRGN